jgi:hypothetical protein
MENKIHEDNSVTLRKLPYPFRAALAICSDIDGTATCEKFLAIQEFLNTERETALGPGLGLEIGNSFFPYSADDSFAYFSSRPQDRETLRRFIRAGYVDCLHSYGDGACSRDDALRALEQLERDGCCLDTWVDHDRAPSNLGRDVTAGLGDVPGAPIYHADAMLQYGVRFAWMGRVSSIVGHERPLSAGSFLHLYDAAHPFHSLRHTGRELVKTVLARLGNRKFAIHAHNGLLRVASLRDGGQLYEFKRANNHWRGTSYALSDNLAYVLSRRTLARLLDVEGCMIVYTHLGRGPESPPYLSPEARAALHGLAAEYRAGHIYVTTTSRLLNYLLTWRHLRWSYALSPGGHVEIEITGVDDPLKARWGTTSAMLQGLTFYVPDCWRASVYLSGDLLPRLERNPADHTGRESVTIPRRFLIYPA